jgi:hypothetical protein
MSIEQLSSNDKVRLNEWLTAGMSVLQQVDDLKEGLKDATKALAEEYDLKPAILNRALRTAYKADMSEQKEGFEQIEAILEATGQG